MAYPEDLKRIFGEREGGFASCELSLYGSTALVVAGHRGLSFLSAEEVVVRRKGGNIRITGKDLSLKKASPFELYISGKISCIEYLGEVAP